MSQLDTEPGAQEVKGSLGQVRVDIFCLKFVELIEKMQNDKNETKTEQKDT